MDQLSTTHFTKGLSEAEKGTMEMSTEEKDFPLQHKSLSASYNKSPIHMMDSTIKLPSVLASQRFCEKENLPMISGKKHHQISCSSLLRQFRERLQPCPHPSSLQNGFLPQRSSHSTRCSNEWITNMPS